MKEMQRMAGRVMVATRQHIEGQSEGTETKQTERRKLRLCFRMRRREKVRARNKVRWRERERDI